MSHLNPIADKILLKFDKWSGALLSLAGRIYLVNSVIASSLTDSMMVYRWPRALLKRVDRAIRNFVWKGNILQNSYGTVSWARTCAPCAEDGVGVRDIRVANESFIFKLTWEIITKRDNGLSFILQRHTTADNREVKYFIASSIWDGTDRIRSAIRRDSRWIPGHLSSVKFWVDNWLGYCIADKVGIDSDARPRFQHLIREFRSESRWILGERFVEEHPDICADIVGIKIA